MKATVDSRELEEKVKIASVFSSKKAGASFANAALLEVRDNWLLIRTSTGEQHSLQAVNAFDTESGTVVTSTAALSAAIFDTGEMMEISVGKKILLKSGTYEARLSILGVDESDFPVMFETEEVIRLPDKIIRTAVRHTSPLADTMDPMKSSVYLVPDLDRVYVVGTDGLTGFTSLILAEMENRVTIDSTQLMNAAAGLSGMIRIGMGEHGRIVSVSGDGPSRVNFTVATDKWTDQILNFFTMEPNYSFFVSSNDVDKLKRLCSAALGADDTSAMIIYESGGKGIVEVHGDVLRFDDEIETCVGYAVFTCKMLNRAIANLMPAEKYEIQVLDRGQKLKFWRWHYDNNVHFAGLANPERIKGRLEELGIAVNTATNT